MSGFDQQSVAANGGVAWAKQLAQCLAPSGVNSQIDGYFAAVHSLEHVRATLQAVKNKLEATWSGDAATAATQSFQETINRVALVQDQITLTIVPPLQDARNAQESFVAAMGSVPDEKPIPQDTGQDVLNYVISGTPLPSAVAAAGNMRARTQAATALNSLSSKYQTSAARLGTVDGMSFVETTTQSTAAFNLGAPIASTGTSSSATYRPSATARRSTAASTLSSSGAAAASRSSSTAHPTAGSSGSVSSTSGRQTSAPANVDTTPTTSLAGTSAAPDAAGATQKLGGSTVGSVAGGATGGTRVPSDSSGERGLWLPGSSGSPVRGATGGPRAVGETNFSDGQLTGGSGTGTYARNTGAYAGTSTGDGTTLVPTQTPGSRSEGATTGESPESMTAAGMPMADGGMGAGDGGYGTSASPYSRRGRYLDPFAEPEPELPDLPLVASAFDGATDRRGRRVDMFDEARGQARGDEDTRRRPRPPTAEEQEESCIVSQRFVPPVIE